MIGDLALPRIFSGLRNYEKSRRQAGPWLARFYQIFPSGTIFSELARFHVQYFGDLQLKFQIQLFITVKCFPKLGTQTILACPPVLTFLINSWLSNQVQKLQVTTRFFEYLLVLKLVMM